MGAIMILIAALEHESPDDQQFMLNVYEQFKPIMFKTAWNVAGDPFVVEDLIQDSLVKLIPKVGTLREFSSCTLCAYIVYTVRNTAINYLKHQKVIDSHIVQYEFQDYEERVGNGDFTPEDLILMAEHKNEFSQIWMQFPDEDQALFKGKYVLELSDVDLAKQFNCKPSSIRMKLTRARRRALDLLGKGEWSHDKA